MPEDLQMTRCHTHSDHSRRTPGACSDVGTANASKQLTHSIPTKCIQMRFSCFTSEVLCTPARTFCLFKMTKLCNVRRMIFVRHTSVRTLLHNRFQFGTDVPRRIVVWDCKQPVSSLPVDQNFARCIASDNGNLTATYLGLPTQDFF